MKSYRRTWLALVLLAVLASASCEARHLKQDEELQAGPSSESALPPADRIIAIGDTHGDLAVLTGALQKGGAIDDALKWVGGKLVVVITGDVLDRGVDELAMLDLIARLQKEATAAGGALHMLNGNHELLNVQLMFPMVEKGGFAPFRARWGQEKLDDEFYQRFPKKQRARAFALRPGGPLALQLSANRSALIIGDTLFVHGGIRPKHAAQGLDKMNKELSEWLAGKRRAISPRWVNRNSPVWIRDFSDDPDEEDCKNLAQTLSMLKVKRMVVGHTIQEHIAPACDGKVWRIDTGMNRKHFKGPIEVLEITPDGPRPVE